jgi:hypothetical protein
MSTVVMTLPIRNVDAEVEVKLEVENDFPTITEVTICNGEIQLDLKNLMLLMGQDEWEYFCHEAHEVLLSTEEEVCHNPIGRCLHY